MEISSTHLWILVPSTDCSDEALDFQILVYRHAIRILLKFRWELVSPYANSDSGLVTLLRRITLVGGNDG